MANMMTCKNCGFRGLPETVRPGMLWLEIVLWLMIAPGLVYTVWRNANTRVVCPSCQKRTMVKDDATMVRNINDKVMEATKVCPHCAGLIKASAVACKHCGKDIKQG